jgi:hypothetical protein
MEISMEFHGLQWNSGIPWKIPFIDGTIFARDGFLEQNTRLGIIVGSPM